MNGPAATISVGELKHQGSVSRMCMRAGPDGDESDEGVTESSVSRPGPREKRGSVKKRLAASEKGRYFKQEL